MLKSSDGRSKGFGTVSFADQRAQCRAIITMNNRMLMNRRIKVAAALASDDVPSAPATPGASLTSNVSTQATVAASSSLSTSSSVSSATPDSAAASVAGSANMSHCCVVCLFGGLEMMFRAYVRLLYKANLLSHDAATKNYPQRNKRRHDTSFELQPFPPNHTQHIIRFATR